MSYFKGYCDSQWIKCYCLMPFVSISFVLRHIKTARWLSNQAVFIIYEETVTVKWTLRKPGLLSLTSSFSPQGCSQRGFQVARPTLQKKTIFHNRRGNFKLLGLHPCLPETQNETIWYIYIQVSYTWTWNWITQISPDTILWRLAAYKGINSNWYLCLMLYFNYAQCSPFVGVGGSHNVRQWCVVML